ncbi:hypothetical protein V7457_27335 [Bacillus toyonensis]|uniref:hypothetical protein n=1 Tax=Bacillus toyonensis TaxID=155322 RepID=UPI0030006D82
MPEELNGNGRFEFISTENLEGSFKINLDVQNPWDKNKNIIIGEFNGIARDEIINMDLFSPWNFTGTTLEGKKVTGTNLALIGTSEKIEDNRYNCTFEISQLILGESQECEYFEFWVPNFIIKFDQISDGSAGQVIHNKTYLNLDFRQESFSIELTGVNGLGSDKNILKRQDDFISVKVIIRKQSGLLTYDLATELMDILLDLCSIAYGCKLKWTNMLGYTNDCEIFHCIRKIRPDVLNPFRKLINVNWPKRLAYFIQDCFPVYSAFNNETIISIRKLTEGIHLASSKLVFPIPFIIIGSTIEEFVQSELGDIDVNYITKADRRQTYSYFKSLMEEHIDPLLSEEDRTELMSNQTLPHQWKVLFQRNLHARITKLLQEYQLEFTDEHIKNFVKKRNKATHGGYEFSSSDYIIWSYMVTLLEKVLLKKLQYNGEYIDFSTEPPELKRLSIDEV